MSDKKMDKEERIGLLNFLAEHGGFSGALAEPVTADDVKEVEDKSIYEVMEEVDRLSAEFDEECAEFAAANLNETAPIYSKVDRLFAVREEMEALETEEKQLKKAIQAYLEENDELMFRSNVGTVSLQHKSRISVPKDQESKEKLFNYLEERGLYWDFVTINSNSLNAWYGEELDAALDSGLPGVEVPGTGAPFETITLSVRKNAKRKDK